MTCAAVGVGWAVGAGRPCDTVSGVAGTTWGDEPWLGSAAGATGGATCVVDAPRATTVDEFCLEPSAEMVYPMAPPTTRNAISAAANQTPVGTPLPRGASGRTTGGIE